MNRRSLFKISFVGIAGLLGAKDGIDRLIEAKTEPAPPSCVVDPPIWTTDAWASTSPFPATMPPFTKTPLFTMTPDPMSDHYWIAYEDGRVVRVSSQSLVEVIPWSY